jgi:hypothetical protein
MSEFARHAIRSNRLQSGPFYTVLNRTNKPLTVTVDGVQFVMVPGDNPDIPSAVAQYCERQHPRRGTFDSTLQFGESLLVVKELCGNPDLMTMIAPGQEHLGVEMTDRKANPAAHATSFEQLPRVGNRDEANPFGNELPGAIVLETPDR